MLIIGIDPGITGSICFFQDGKIIDVIEMPNMPEGKKNKKQDNGALIYFVRPAKWKKYFNLINSEKDASRTRAIEIFPYFSSQLSRKKDSNKADAILIASFYYETYKTEE